MVGGRGVGVWAQAILGSEFLWGDGIMQIKIKFRVVVSILKAYIL